MMIVCKLNYNNCEIARRYYELRGYYEKSHSDYFSPYL
jgi:hypothetical protein